MACHRSIAIYSDSESIGFADNLSHSPEQTQTWSCQSTSPVCVASCLSRLDCVSHGDTGNSVRLCRIQNDSHSTLRSPWSGSSSDWGHFVCSTTQMTPPRLRTFDSQLANTVSPRSITQVSYAWIIITTSEQASCSRPSQIYWSLILDVSDFFDFHCSGRTACCSDRMRDYPRTRWSSWFSMSDGMVAMIIVTNGRTLSRWEELSDCDSMRPLKCCYMG